MVGRLLEEDGRQRDFQELREVRVSRAERLPCGFVLGTGRDFISRHI